MSASSASPPEAVDYIAPKRRWLRWLEPTALLGPGGLWLVAFLVAPVGLILLLSLVPNIKPDNFSRIAQIGFNPANYLRVLDPIYLLVIWRSLLLAFNGALFCLLLGFPVAYWIALYVPKRWQNIVLLAFVLPLWTSSLLRTYAWITILRPTGVLNGFLSAVGLPTVQLLNSYPAMLIGVTYSFLPYMVLVLYASLEKLDRRLLEAAADLGANAFQTFWKVTVPQTLPGIAAGSLLVFITSLGDFINPDLLGGTSGLTVARLIQNQFLGATRNWGFGSALSMVLIMGVAISIALLLKYGDRSAADV
ncbi:ABC transporter permease [Leptolyngbya sp. FACHB-261]|uniref:ABC transporter permease n=1 Tax=Leptolyngbya sp. FACHB-261 TaxID=2692806 RepID=UPI001685BF8A|nr:ABC transporter permease [Leptolyngbya sp. FACHB-261]MBD2100538.1 ABC transporter permease [Leptolyngbya sp. FACHB-261]